MNTETPMTTTLEEKPAVNGSDEMLGGNRLIIAIGNKGGASKSFLLRTIAEMHLEHAAATKSSRTIVLADGDNTTGSFSKYHANVEKFALHDADERRYFLTRVLGQRAPLVLADFPAMSLATLTASQNEYDFFSTVAMNGYDVTMVLPITPYEDTIRDLQDAIELGDPELAARYDALVKSGATPEMIAKEKPKRARVKYVAVLNLGMAAGKIRNFVLWNNAKYTRGLLEFVGGVLVTFPALEGDAAAIIDHNKLTFTAAATAEQLDIVLRQCVVKFNRDARTAFEPAYKHLGLS